MAVRARVNGEAMPVIPRPVADRFWEKVDKNGPVPEHRSDLGPCWVWTAGKVHNGYGRFAPSKRGKKIKAHTWAYLHVVGEISVGLELDHLCRNRACVNPAHLEPVTHRENLLRGDSLAGRAARKTHCPQGHEYSPANTYVGPRGDRACRTCKRRRTRERKKQTIGRATGRGLTGGDGLGSSLVGGEFPVRR